jgi:hypothetical protein
MVTQEATIDWAYAKVKVETEASRHMLEKPHGKWPLGRL